MTPLPATLETLAQARHAGLTLRQAAVKAGVHVATVCRWQKRDPAIKQWLQQATEAGKAERQKTPPERPGVYWRKDCPECKARVVIRKAGCVPFWRCGRWPLCPWSSWRPRAKRDCPRCGSARYWSHSRQSVGCDGCGLRTTGAKAPKTASRGEHFVVGQARLHRLHNRPMPLSGNGLGAPGGNRMCAKPR
jgi:hypothetical protein